MRFTVLVVVPWLSAAADHSLTFIGFPTTPLFLGTKYPIEVRRTNNETHGDAVRVTPFTKCGCIQFRPPVIDIEAATPSTSFIIEAMNPPADGSSQVKISYGIEASSAFSDPCPPEIVQSGHAPRFCMITVNVRNRLARAAQCACNLPRSVRRWRTDPDPPHSTSCSSLHRRPQPFRMQSGHKGFIGIGTPPSPRAPASPPRCFSSGELTFSHVALPGCSQGSSSS